MASNVIHAKVDGVRLLNQMTLNIEVTYGTELRWRLRVGQWLIALLAWVWGCEVVVANLDIVED